MNDKSHDFIKSSASEEITSVIEGKTVIKFENDSEGMDDFIIFYFSDNSTLRIRYDWLYEWQFLEGKNE